MAACEMYAWIGNILPTLDEKVPKISSYFYYVKFKIMVQI
jgi:hypothetical protein